MSDAATAAAWIAAIAILGVVAAMLIWDLVKVQKQETATVSSIVPEAPATEGNGGVA